MFQKITEATQLMLLIELAGIIKQKVGMYAAMLNGNMTDAEIEERAGKEGLVKAKKFMADQSKDSFRGHINGLIDALMLVSTSLAQKAQSLRDGMPDDVLNMMPDEVRQNFDEFIDNPFVIKEMMGVPKAEVQAAKDMDLSDVNQAMWDMLDKMGTEGQA